MPVVAGILHRASDRLFVVYDVYLLVSTMVRTGTASKPSMRECEKCQSFYSFPLFSLFP